VPGVRPIKPKWNKPLVGSLLPVRRKLNGDASQSTQNNTQ
jgi:hypothetical protein